MLYRSCLLRCLVSCSCWAELEVVLQIVGEFESLRWRTKLHFVSLSSRN